MRIALVASKLGEPDDYITKLIDIEKLLSLLRIWMPARRGAPR